MVDHAAGRCKERVAGNLSLRNNLSEKWMDSDEEMEAPGCGCCQGNMEERWHVRRGDVSAALETPRALNS